MATEALHAHVQSEVANALTVLRTGLQQSLQEVATVTNAHEERLSALETSERTPSRRDNVTAKRETESLPVFGEKHGPVDADWCFDVYTAVEKVCEEVNLITQWVDSFGHVGRGHSGQFHGEGMDEGAKRAGRAVGSETALLRLDSETDRTSEGVGITRGATTWQRGQIHAAGVTQNRRLELLDAVSHPKSFPSYCQVGKGRFGS